MRCALVAAVLVAGCASPPRFGLDLEIVDESGAPLAAAVVTVNGEAFAANDRGRVHLPRLTRPVVAIVRADGFVPEPVPLGREDEGESVVIELLDDLDGGRVTLHFAGDCMVGRRYLSLEDGDPLVVTGDGGASAAAVVDAVAPAFALADLSVANLETVVGTLADDAAYPGKRWLLQTPPEGLAALDAMGVDLAVLANNHQADWLDPGMRSTLDATRAAGLPTVGGGMDEAEAAVPVVLEAGGLRIGVLAYTTVDGVFVNDAYPDDDAVAPDEIDPEDAWLWAPRTWGAPEVGIPVADRRIGGAWRGIAAAEDAGLDPAARAALWASATASYPELQDWVARRGHGGANLWDIDRARDEIVALRSEVDVIVVQLHMGYQFASAPGDGVREVAYAASRYGADLVVAHHPHVLQGAEWDDDTLIVWSLGNFVFDQDFLSTHPSAFLRVVLEPDGTIARATLMPIRLDAYRPVPVVAREAEDTLRTLWERSMAAETARRGDDLRVRSVVDERGEAPRFVRRHHVVDLVRGDTPEEEIVVEPGPDGVAVLPGDRLYLPPRLPPGVALGRVVSGPGDFEDHDTDSDRNEAAGWTWASADVRIQGRDAGAGALSLELIRGPDNTDDAFARPVARADLPDHRLFADADGIEPLDGAASYSVRLRARLIGEPGLAAVRLVLYHFDDLDPTRSPSSAVLNDFTVAVPATDTWQDLVVDLPSEAFAPVDGLAPNAALLYVLLHPPASRTTVLRVDDLGLVEWRWAADEPYRAGAYDLLRNTISDEPVAVDTLTWAP